MTQRNSFDRFNKTFDIEDPAFAEQFEDVLEHLITNCPVAHSTVGPGYHWPTKRFNHGRHEEDWQAEHS